MLAAGPPPPVRRNDIRIRRARASDLDALADLEAGAFVADRMSRRSIRTLIRSPSARLLVAEHGAEIVGTVVVLTRRGTSVARLYSLAVASGAARRGVGSSLLAAAEAAARTSGALLVRLEVRADNPAAIRFYEERGYRLSASRENYYEDGMTALVYSRDLSGAGRASSPRSVPRAA